MINTLEEIGAINRKNMYKVTCDRDDGNENVCTVELDDDTRLELSGGIWKQVIQTGLSVCGYVNGQKIRNIHTLPSDYQMETNG